MPTLIPDVQRLLEFICAGAALCIFLAFVPFIAKQVRRIWRIMFDDWKLL